MSRHHMVLSRTSFRIGGAGLARDFLRIAAMESCICPLDQRATLPNVFRRAACDCHLWNYC